MTGRCGDLQEKFEWQERIEYGFRWGSRMHEEYIYFFSVNFKWVECKLKDGTLPWSLNYPFTKDMEITDSPQMLQMVSFRSLECIERLSINQNVIANPLQNKINMKQ